MRYEQSKLSNGLQIVSLPMRDRKSAAVAVWVRTGSRFESKQLSGASHFLEHMLFKGTRKRSTRKIKEEIEGVGGMLNAFTGEEVTCYYTKILAEYVPRALEVLCDMVLNATLNKKEFEKERTVILEEIKMYKDLPSQYVQEIMSELLWPNQGIGRAIAGTEQSVKGITRSKLMKYMKNYYHPKNILITVSGPVSHWEVVRLAEKYVKRSSKLSLSQYSKSKVKQTSPRHLFVEKDTEQTNFVIGFHALSRYDKERYSLALLNVILGANMSSRLFEELREKRGLAYEIRSGLGFFEDTGLMYIHAGVETGKTEKSLQLILKELLKVSSKGVSIPELTRAKEYFMSQLHMGLEDTLDHALWLGERFIYSQKTPDVEAINREILNVTPSAVKSIARRVFKNNNLNLTLIGPINKKRHSQIKQIFSLN